MAPIGDGSLLRALGKGVKDKFPIAGAVVETLGPAMIEAIQSGDPEKMELAAKREPQVVNNLNLESPAQSGTTWGMGIALLTAIGAIGSMIQSGDIDPAVLGPLIATVLASVFGLWRRWGSGLTPLFSRRK